MSKIIVDILKQFLGEPHEHNEETGQTSWDCPACAEDKGLSHGDGDGNHKLAINYQRNIFRCWRCAFENNMYGKVPKLIKRYGNNRILKEYVLVRPDNDGEKHALTQIEVKLPKGFKKLTDCDSSSYKYDTAYKYITDRGITDEMIDFYNIGYVVSGKRHDRIIIPSYDEFGDLNYYIARSWGKWNKPKYLNPQAEKQLLIFNENKINWDGTIFLVEGAFDHIVIPNSIPLLGKMLSEKLKIALLEKSRAEVVIVLDEDAYDAALRIYKNLNVGGLYNRIKICIPPYGQDPSSIFEKDGNNGIIKLLKTSKQIPESRLY